MRNAKYIFFFLVLISMLLASCNPTPEQVSPSTSDPVEEVQSSEVQPVEDKQATEEKGLIVYITPDLIGVNEFYNMGKAALDAIEEMYDVETVIMESSDTATREENLRAAANMGATIIYVLGYEFNDFIGSIANEHPETKFLIVDQCIEDRPDNIHCVRYREHEASFLIGAAAAMMSKTGILGTINATDSPFSRKYHVGFELGAQYINPDIKVEKRFVGGANPYADPARAKELALSLNAIGADIIFASAVAGNYGIFEALQEKDFLAFGVDVNQCPLADGYIIDNLLKRTDVSTIAALSSLMEGENIGEVYYGLKEGGVGLVSLVSEDNSSTKCLLGEEPEVLAKLKELQEKIINGEITIEDPMYTK